jgi:dTDP-4-amino-4,6-dideoxygalactose transaminase
MGGEELSFVHDVFASNWIAPAGPQITIFEEELASYTGTKHCAALSSGTAAIHLALQIVGVRPGDDVICQSFTFAGSCNPVTYVGATPVLVDSEPATWNMDPALLRRAVQERQRKGRKIGAIIAVHLYGMPAAMDEIMGVGREYGVPVIEDAAEALGAEYKGKKCGSIGDIGILSFNGNKIITTSGGGAVLSGREEYVAHARFLATQARDPAPHYEHSRIGYNYRLSNVCAAIGLGQMKVLDEHVGRRREIYEYYRLAFRDIGSMRFFPEPSGGVANRWLTTPVFSDGTLPRRVMTALGKENIESRPLWKPMHLQPVYKDAPAYVSGVSEGLFRKGLCLPSGTALTEEELARITQVVKGAVRD